MLGFTPLNDDACVYTKQSDTDNGKLSILIVYMDDFIIAAPSDAEVDIIAEGI
jgi:hypothetical protein